MAIEFGDIRVEAKGFPPLSGNHVAGNQVSNINSRYGQEIDFKTVYIFTVFITGIICNAIVIATIAYNRQLHSVTNYFIVSQCCADFLFAALVLPAYCLQGLLGYWPFMPEWCAIHTCLSISLVMTSLLNLFAISLDRYLAICRPYQYHTWMTTRFVIGMLLYIWFQPLLLALIPVFGWRGVQSTIGSHCVVDLFLYIKQERIYLLIITLINFYIPATIMFTLYILIFKVAIRHIHNIEQQRNVQRKQHYFGSIQDQLNHRYLRLAKNDFRLILVFVIVNGAFYLCWTPFMTFGLISLFHLGPVTDNLGIACSLMAFTNCTLNPIIHNFFNREIRSGFFRMVCFHTRRKLINRSNTHISGTQCSSTHGSTFVIRHDLISAKDKAIIEQLVNVSRMKAKKVTYI
ncbi:5-hydroxytryptamine receptor 4 [Trichoplax sp. H2]|nr:5-hydroxytryptamine receptor 4 [Trichoplax sp. H2]|eukprot:RDD39077.1 5-hydroxytryptamine receptor 4 [Trichoplax sp. H2]